MNSSGLKVADDDSISIGDMSFEFLNDMFLLDDEESSNGAAAKTTTPEITGSGVTSQVLELVAEKEETLPAKQTPVCVSTAFSPTDSSWDKLEDSSIGLQTALTFLKDEDHAM
jgi:hypothetical protein